MITADSEALVKITTSFRAQDFRKLDHEKIPEEVLKHLKECYAIWCKDKKIKPTLMVLIPDELCSKVIEVCSEFHVRSQACGAVVFSFVW